MAAASNKENTALAWLKRLWPLLLLLAGMALVFAMGWHRYLTLQELVARREALSAAIAGHTILAVLTFMAIYAATVALSLPGAAVLTLAGGFLFGWFWGGLASMGEIVITARREGSVTLIDVRDTGPGVSERARAHLFQAFQSVARKGGTGLGLAIAAELVSAHGGEIMLVSNEGGATFRVIIPDVVVELQRARRRSA